MRFDVTPDLLAASTFATDGRQSITTVASRAMFEQNVLLSMAKPMSRAAAGLT